MTLIFSTTSEECPPCAAPVLNHGRSDMKKRGKDHQVPSQGRIQLTVLLKVILSSTHLGSIYLADTWIGPCKDLLWKLKLLCEHSNVPSPPPPGDSDSPSTKSPSPRKSLFARLPFIRMLVCYKNISYPTLYPLQQCLVHRRHLVSACRIKYMQDG